MKFFTFWEQSAYLHKVPPYILCALITMRLTFKESFLLLNKSNLKDWVDFDFESKLFYFSSSSDKDKDALSKIVAKSDFIRLYFVYKHGGFWLDADTIILSDFMSNLLEMVSDKLVWHSEQLFGATIGNSLVKVAAENMIESERQVFGNPGGIKDIVGSNKDKVTFIPLKIWSPRLDGSYSAKSWDMMTRTDMNVDTFLTNKECCLVKIYNSELGKLPFSQMSVEDFLRSDILLSRMFLHINPDISFWVEQVDALKTMMN
ncbi:MAG TPA: glycosyltransferase [Solidesulfovibrio magneticus]|nr:glycosyltransferase [Solidesulfovibrio magneticus]